MSDREDEGQVSALPPLGDAPRVVASSTPPRPGPRASAAGTPESPTALIIVGLFVGAVLGGGLSVAGGASDVGVMVLLGYLAMIVGSLVTSVGVIAAGVRLGMRWARLDSSSEASGRP